MRIASFNVENLFDRPKAMNLDRWSEGRPILEQYAQLSQLLGETSYAPSMKKRMVKLLTDLGLRKSDTGEYVILRRNRGALVKRNGTLEVVAEGRADWVGSLELREEPIDEQAMRNTARVIRDLNADILGVVETENRPVLRTFNLAILKAMGGAPYRHVMVIDGNDERGIDVGLMTRTKFLISQMKSHVDDRQAGGAPLFCRDCPEYTVTTPSGNSILVMVCHFKSKGFGTPESNNRRRRLEAQRAAEIYKQRIAEGIKYIAILGDLNDTPDSKPLEPLVGSTTLKDVFVHPTFDDGGYPGTYKLANASDKIDYLLLSPALFSKVKSGGVYRKGVWAGKRPVRWEMYDEIVQPEDAASDHAAVWADIDI